MHSTETMGAPHTQSFTETFFSLSSVSSDVRSDHTIRKCLHKIRKAGWSIDSTHVVFGCEGVYWPLLRTNKGISTSSGWAIGKRGSTGFSSRSLAEYLQDVKQQLRQRGKDMDLEAEVAASARNPFTDQRDAQCEPRPVTPEKSRIVPHCTHPSGEALDQSVISLLEMMSAAGGCSGLGDALSLEELRRTFKMFLGPVPLPINTLSPEALLGATFMAFHNGKCLIRKGNDVLACDEGLHILPKGPMGYFDYGNNQFSDVPCTDSVRLSFPLKSRSKLITLLPYLQGIPRYES